MFKRLMPEEKKSHLSSVVLGAECGNREVKQNKLKKRDMDVSSNWMLKMSTFIYQECQKQQLEKPQRGG